MADQEEVLANLGQFIDKRLPGVRRHAPILSYMGAFGIAAREGGQVLVWARSDEPWFLTFTAGIARDVADLGGALSWVNQKNSDLSFGRYYASIPEEGAARANVVWEEQIFSGLLDEAPQILNGHVIRLLRATMDIASNEPHPFVEAVGGSPFGDDNDNRGILAMAALG